MRFFTPVKRLHSRFLLSWKVCSAIALLLGFALLVCVSLIHWKEARAGEEKAASAGSDREPGRRRVIAVAGGGGASFYLDRGRLLMASRSQVRDVLRNQVLYTVPAHKGGAGIIFSPDGSLIATSADVFVPTEPQHNIRHDLRLRDAKTGQSATLLYSTETGINDFAFSPNGKLIAAAVAELLPAFVGYSILLWDARTGERVRLLWRGREDKDNPMEHLVFHPDNKLLIASDGGRLYFWDVTDGKLLRTVAIGGKGEHKGIVRSLAISPDGKLLAVADSGGGNANAKVWEEQTSLIRLFELPSGKEVAVLDGHPNPTLWSVAFRRNGRWLASVGGDKTLKIWDVPKRKLLYTLSLDNEASSVAFSPDDRWLAVGEYERTLLFDLVPDPQ